MQLTPFATVSIASPAPYAMTGHAAACTSNMARPKSSPAAGTKARALHELLGQMDQAITDHAYPPPVRSPGEVVVDHMQISTSNLAAGSYAVWMGMYSQLTQVRANIAAEMLAVSEDRARLLEFQLAP